MSKLLQKILSAAILPAALLIVSKIAGMALANYFFDLDWSLQTNTGTIFSVQVVYPDEESALICNSFSNLFMIVSLLIGTCVLLFQSKYLNVSNQNPKVLIKLIQFDFIMWLSESSSIFPRLFVWMAFLWISTIITAAQTIQSMTYSWVTIFGLVSSVLVTWAASHEFDKEIHTILPENGKLVIE
jgi:uncharacterized membrane protein (DUF441 family)